MGIRTDRPRHPSVSLSRVSSTTEEILPRSNHLSPTNSLNQTTSDSNMRPEAGASAPEEVLSRQASSNLSPSRRGSKMSLSKTVSTNSTASSTTTLLSSNSSNASLHPSVRISVKEIMLGNWLNNFWRARPGEERQKWESASNEPPISAQSLAELEISCIVANPKLRHDINFDRELHFRPNLEGERGKNKLHAADEYWAALETELALYTFLLTDEDGASFRFTDPWAEEFKKAQRRIPRMFLAISEILSTMMPERDQPKLDEALDVPLIMQQIERGMLDLSGMANWLSNLLKAHCAPMRDQWVEKMEEQIVKGSETFDAKLIIGGLKELFGILEAMKLDVANHQIRHLRPMLLENTVQFEQAYYLRKLANGQVDVKGARQWLEHSKHLQDTADDDSDTSGVFKTFINSFVSTLVAPSAVATSTSGETSSSSPILPPTFKLDALRLQHLRTDLHNLIYTDLTLRRLSHLLYFLGAPASVVNATISSFRQILPVLVGNTHSPRGASSSNSISRWHSRLGNVAVEIVRTATTAVAKEKSPRNTNVEEILDGVNIGELYDATESWLRRNLRQDSHLFAARAAALRLKLATHVYNETVNRVALRPDALLEAFVATKGNKSTTEKDTGLSKVQVARLQMQKRRQSKGAVDQEARVEDKNKDERFDAAVRKASHIALLHWKVWAPLVYVKADEEEEEEEGEAKQAEKPAAAELTRRSSQSSSGPVVAASNPAPSDPTETPEQQIRTPRSPADEAADDSSESAGDASKGDVEQQVPFRHREASE